MRLKKTFALLAALLLLLLAAAAQAGELRVDFYDMGKAVQKDMQITNIRLLRKSGGKSGNYIAEE